MSEQTTAKVTVEFTKTGKHEFDVFNDDYEKLDALLKEFKKVHGQPAGTGVSGPYYAVANTPPLSCSQEAGPEAQEKVQAHRCVLEKTRTSRKGRSKASRSKEETDLESGSPGSCSRALQEEVFKESSARGKTATRAAPGVVRSKGAKEDAREPEGVSGGSVRKPYADVRRGSRGNRRFEGRRV